MPGEGKGWNPPLGLGDQRPHQGVDPPPGPTTWMACVKEVIILVITHLRSTAFHSLEHPPTLDKLAHFFVCPDVPLIELPITDER